MNRSEAIEDHVERGKEGGRDYRQQRTHGYGSIRQQQQARWANFTIPLNYKEPSHSPQPIALSPPWQGLRGKMFSHQLAKQSGKTFHICRNRGVRTWDCRRRSL